MLPIGGNPDPLQPYVSVTTTCVAVAFTLKLNEAGGKTVRITVTVWLFAGLAHEALIVMLNGPLPVVIRVGTESVALLGNELTELGVIVGVTPGGAPEITVRLTVPLNPPEAAKLSVYKAVLPAPTLCEGGVAVIEKSTPVEMKPLIDNTNPAVYPLGNVEGNAPYTCPT